MSTYLEDQVNHISELLEQRMAVYPRRDAKIGQQLDQAMETFAHQLRAETDFNNFSPNPALIQTANHLATRPVFICGSMKSGTSLVTQLLDGHPSLLVMPADSHYANLIDTWSQNQFEDISTYWVKRLINPSGKEPFWFLGTEVESFQDFLLYLSYFLNNTKRDVFVCVVLALFAANSLAEYRRSGHWQDKRYWVEKTPHNELHAPMLQNRFPRARFIHVLRDPLPNIASLKRLADIRGWRTLPIENVQMLKKLFQAAESNLREFNHDHYLSIHYEKLVASPEPTLNEICTFLDIAFEDILLTPTENRSLGQSNSMYADKRVTGTILNTETTSYLSQLSEQEKRQIVTLLYPLATRLGYNWDTDKLRGYRQGRLAAKLTYGRSLLQIGKAKTARKLRKYVNFIQ